MTELDSGLTTEKKIIAQNLADLQKSIKLACSRSRHSQDSVELVISTKYLPVNSGGCSLIHDILVCNIGVPTQSVGTR